MATSTPRERLSENITEITTLGVTGTWLAAMFLGVSWWLPFMLFGYIIIVPLVAILFGDESDIEEWIDDKFDRTDSNLPAQSANSETPDFDPLEELRHRYANGELTDDQFERKLEKLLETETLEDAAEWHQRQRERESTRNR